MRPAMVCRSKTAGFFLVEAILFRAGHFKAKYPARFQLLSLIRQPSSGGLHQAALDFATWVAMASISAGDRQS
jgi:hypothetical protein